MSLLGVLFVVFMVLKLVGVIAWSWWWVAAPIWVPLAVILAACILAAIAEGSN